MDKAGEGTRHLRSAAPFLAAAVFVAAVVAIVWIMFLDATPGFSDDSRARKVAFAQWNGDVLVIYHRCGEEDLIPYVEAWEVIRNDLHEWEVHNRFWGSDEASWITGRHAVGEASSLEPPKEEYGGSLPPASEIRMNVHVYSASYENRWHVRVEELLVADLPVAGGDSTKVLSANGEMMARIDWMLRARETCGFPSHLSLTGSTLPLARPAGTLSHLSS